ncbi:flavin-containing monooxygenase [Simplicispira piscis]
MQLSVEELAKCAASAELAPLLCALAEATGDRALLEESFRPKLQAEMIVVPADGGVDADVAKRARERIVDSLARWMEQGQPAPAKVIPVDDLIAFMTAGDTEHAALLREELGGKVAGGMPGWSKKEIAPEREFQVAIIGAGPSGLGMAYELARAGVSFTVLDINSDVGGTWYLNTYPGCRLDTGRLSYSYSFAQRKDWKHFFTKQEDLLRYYQEFAQDSGLQGCVAFHSEVVSAVYSPDSARWVLTIKDTRTGEQRQQTFDAVVSAVGVLHQPKIPHFEGADQFDGKVIHSARWQHDIDLRGKRVSIIGTGASAYQIAPAIAKDVAQLNVFQRSAPWMLPTPKYHHEVPQEERTLIEKLPNFHRWLRLWEFWHSTIGKYALTKADPAWEDEGSVSEPNQRFRQDLETRIRAQYTDRADLVESVIPKYPVGAKRMLRDNGVWATTLKSPNVKLVTDPITHFVKNGIVTSNGDVHQSDLIICATGFDVSNYLGTFEVIGKNGTNLREKWGDEARAYLGIGIPGFPNFFCLAGPNTGLVAIGSQTFMSECGIHYVSQTIHHLLKHQLQTVEPTDQAYSAFIQWVDDGNRAMAWGAAKIQSWYRNSNGTVVASWPYPLLTYWQATRSVDPSAFATQPL